MPRPILRNPSSNKIHDIMRFDTIIIGGGLAGLVCGLRLQEAGKQCAIVSAGQNAMHFFSGGFGLLSRMPDGTPVESPLNAIPALDAAHPYSRIGVEKIARYAEEARTLLRSHGINVDGTAEKNRFIISASGTLKPSWLTIDDIASVSSKDEKIAEKALIVNIEGFLDFNTSFIAAEFEKRGTTCRIEAVTTDEIRQLRRNPSEMRASNIARLMEKSEVREKFISAVKAELGKGDETAVILPAVFGLTSHESVEAIREAIGVKTLFIGTLPPSVPGIRSQMQLKSAFEAAGGTFLMGDEVSGTDINDGKVTAVRTANIGDINLTADTYVLASGSYFGHGIVADMDKVYEPVFGSDVIFNEDRNSWYDKNFFSRQEFIGFGVATDSDFKVLKGGRTISNLYAAGSVLGGFNPLYEGCGAGVAIMTAFQISDSILGR